VDSFMLSKMLVLLGYGTAYFYKKNINWDQH